MSRTIILANYRTHPYYKKLLAKLKQPQLIEMEQFLVQHDHLGHIEFEQAVNRMYLDKHLSPKEMKSSGIVQELLISANSAVYVGAK